MIWREGTEADVPAVVALLLDDELGKWRENADPSVYLSAFRTMQSEGANHLIVGEEGGELIACYQITFIASLSLGATRRGQIEGVRVAASRRGQRIGEALMKDAEARARAAGCAILQLTTNKIRTDAHRFYERLGFTPSHIGYKKSL
ncbi:GCN5-related N-acetyltransferase [Paracoccus aminophilus JCM 7686]|uniref:GCN5-related N-acetyltransferase n=2 Tax=Paracoccus aminophilus TaxID=34003 RepID=S5XTA1_PARAH|nr:GCN5-related N-acetyltransferase [Paracoccus aminophilus JCM 7686]